jgi:hypothetical protein
VDADGRRRNLTPLSGELTFRDTDQEIRRAGRRRFAPPRRLIPRLPVPKTTAGAVAWAFVRIGLAVAVSAGVALLIDYFLDRSPAVAFYIVGAVVLAVAFLFSAADTESAYWDAEEREARVRGSFLYMVVGGLVIVIGVLIEVRG